MDSPLLRETKGGYEFHIPDPLGRRYEYMVRPNVSLYKPNQLRSRRMAKAQAIEQLDYCGMRIWGERWADIRTLPFGSTVKEPVLAKVPGVSVAVYQTIGAGDSIYSTLTVRAQLVNSAGNVRCTRESLGARGNRLLVDIHVDAVKWLHRRILAGHPAPKGFWEAIGEIQKSPFHNTIPEIKPIAV